MLKQTKNLRSLSIVLLLPLLLTARLPDAAAAVTVYTSRAAFLLDAAPFGPATLDFESETAGTTLTDPTTLGGITFSGFASPALIIDDAFEATSGVNYLGVDNPGTFNQFSFGDDPIDLAFAPGNAIGLNLITAEIPGITLFDDDFRIEVPGIGTVRLDVDDADGVTAGGDLIYFLGLIDDTNPFTTARLEGSGAFGFYNLDDITTAVIPEPGSGLFAAVVVLAACGLRLRATRRRTRTETP